jgi:AcrR family transcriptional regulator
MSSRKNSRQVILDAAETVVRENGAAHLTLDAVCAKAGLSKGGLLYHFRTKETLLQGMLDRLRDTMADARKKEAKKLSDSPARELKAYILSKNALWEKRIQGILTAFLAAGAHDPKLLAPVKKAHERMIDEIRASGFHPEFTHIITLALEGLWVLETLGVFSLSREGHQRIIKELLRLVEVEETKICAG